MAEKLSFTRLSKLMFMFVLMRSTEIDSLSTSRPANKDVISCKASEREALLVLKQGLANMSSDSSTDLSSWGSANDNRECCNWNGVKCSSTTGHVTSLELSYVRGKIVPALLQLSHLNSLDMTYNDFEGCKIPEFIGSLQKLQHLRLSYCNLSGDVPHQLGNLTNLRELDLSANYLTSKDLTWISKLSCLSTLDLSRNDFKGSVPWLSSLSLLNTLALSFNKFEGPLPSLSNLSLLSTLDLSNNQFEGLFPDLKSFSPLSKLYLQYNKLTKLPTSFAQLSNLENLDVSYNSLQGTISEVHFSHLHNLLHLDLSFNSLALNFTPNWIPPFQLSEIILAGCDVGGRLPSWLQTQRNFNHFDLSSANISEELPAWFWDLSHQLVYLNLSHNKISGSILDLSSNFNPTNDPGVNNPSVIDISFNNFSGPLPLFHPDSSILLLSNNVFTGSIQSICRVKYNYLVILNLSNNQLSGVLPNCWENMEGLLVVNIDDNNFSGHLPNSLGSLTQLMTLQFRNNKLKGELPHTMNNCSSLRLIDGGGNELTGSIPVWMGTLMELSTLSLHQNNFYGSIPSEICHLTSIQVLDLSENNISGSIPRCFNNITSMIRTDRWTEKGEIGPYVDNEAVVQWKRHESKYKNKLGLLKLIDLSCNKLVGNIPHEFLQLAGLVSLNLSKNSLTGNIDSGIDKMQRLECLDLSRNKLSGEIPKALARLDSLSVLDLSGNNLSGEIPKGTQLQSFDPPSYAENMGLCGQPLPNCARNCPSSASYWGNEVDIDDKREYFISAAMGYMVGFWIVIGSLLYKKSWRDAYFGYLSVIWDWLHVKTFTRCRTFTIR